MEENLGKGGVAAMLGHGGLCAKVIESGDITIGDEIRASPIERTDGRPLRIPNRSAARERYGTRSGLASLPVRLMNDSRYPWVILIPKVPDISEIHELAEEQQYLLLSESVRLS